MQPASPEVAPAAIVGTIHSDGMPSPLSIPERDSPVQEYPANWFYIPRSQTYITYHDVCGLLEPGNPIPWPAHGVPPRIIATHLTLHALMAETGWGWYRISRQPRGRGGAVTVWYRTCGPFALPSPPAALRADVDDIFVHHDQTLRYKMWVFNCSGAWIALRAGDRQPSHPGRRLWIRRTGEPSWVSRDTHTAYCRELGRQGEI